MRLQLTAAFGAVALAAGLAISMAAPSAGAAVCPPGTIEKRIKNPVTGGTHTICVPGQQCDPGPCDPTAVPNPE
ncbi:MAG TPA: hypothetical protein VNQ77_09715 [Frankiaceae bacterium]|nr:hypothetical protein [Frankiaceae bacterium]